MKKLVSLILALAMFCIAGGAVFAEGELTKVTFALPRSLECLDDAHFLSAMYLGFFEDEGIDFELVATTGTDITKMIAMGEVDMGGPSPAFSFSALAAGMELVSVFQTDVNNIFGLAVLEGSDIQEWKDLEGTTMAVNTATSYMTICPILIAAGVDPDKVELVVAGDQRSVMLAEGKVQSAYTWQKEWQNWKAQGIDCWYLNGEEVLKNVSNSMCVRPEYLAENQDVIERVGRAIAKGIYFCECNPLAAAAITVNRYPTLGLTAEEALPAISAIPSIATPDNGQYGYGDPERWATNLEWAEYYETVEPGSVDLSDFVNNGMLEAYNDWDRAEVEAIAESIDISTIAPW